MHSQLKFQYNFSLKLKRNLKILQNHKRPRPSKTIPNNKRTSGGSTIPDFNFLKLLYVYIYI